MGTCKCEHVFCKHGHVLKDSVVSPYVNVQMCVHMCQVTSWEEVCARLSVVVVGCGLLER